MLLCLAPGALALEHADVLRSGALVVVPAASPVFLLPASDRSGTGARGEDLLPELLAGSGRPGTLSGYREVVGKLLAPADSKLLKPYLKAIDALSAGPAYLAAGRKAVAGVPWITEQPGATLYAGTEPVDPPAMRRLTEASGDDAIAFLKPGVVFSRNLSSLYVIVRVVVYGWGPVHAFPLGSKTFYVRYRLNSTSPALRNFGAEGLAESERTGAGARRARAQVWFESGAARFTEAVDGALKQLPAPISAYLKGPS